MNQNGIIQNVEFKAVMQKMKDKKGIRHRKSKLSKR